MAKRVTKEEVIRVVKNECGCIMYDINEVKAYLLDMHGKKIGTINFTTYLKLKTKPIPYWWYDKVYCFRQYYDLV